MLRRSEKVKHLLNRPLRQKIVHRPELRGQPICNVMTPSEQTSELSNDSNDDDITDNES